jgi:peptidoglycan/xylan/chitin deacetylase (PgdA/CDA1 family)
MNDHQEAAKKGREAQQEAAAADLDFDAKIAAAEKSGDTETAEKLRRSKERYEQERTKLTAQSHVELSSLDTSVWGRINRLLGKLADKIKAFIAAITGGFAYSENTNPEPHEHSEVVEQETPRETTSYVSCDEACQASKGTTDTKLSTHPGQTLTESPDKNKLALTFDICSNYSGDRLNNTMMSLGIIKRNTNYPVTLFVTGSALENDRIYAELSDLNGYPHVSIQPHGLEHRPVTTEHSEPIFKQKPTGDPELAYKEVVDGAKRVEALTGKRPKYFRSATLRTDARAEHMVRILGMRMVAESKGSSDGGGKNREGGVLKKGAVYLGHVSNYDGVRNVYRRLGEQGIETMTLS